MTQHDDSTRLRHMLDYARKAVRFALGRPRDAAAKFRVGRWVLHKP